MVEKMLVDLAEIMQGRCTVDKISQAKDVKAAYEKEKAAMSSKIKELADLAKGFYAHDEFAITEPGKVICPGIAIEVFFIMLMGRLDAHVLFVDMGAELSKALRSSCRISDIGGNCYRLFLNNCITLLSEHEVLEQIFFKF